MRRPEQHSERELNILRSDVDFEKRRRFFKEASLSRRNAISISVSIDVSKWERRR